VLLGIALCALLAAVGGCGDGAPRGPVEALAAQPDAARARRVVAELREPALREVAEVTAWAQLLVLAGETPEALWVLEDARARFPADASLATELARVALRVGDPVRALGALADVPEEAPGHLAALLLQAQAELELGLLEASLETLRGAESLYPAAPEAGLARILLLFREARFEEADTALAELREAARAPEFARMLDGLSARFDLAHARYEAAIERIESLLVATPNDLALLQLLAEALQRMGRGAEALERIRSASPVGERGSEFDLLEARFLVMQKRFDEAEFVLRAAADTASDVAAHQALALLYSVRGERASAARVYAEAVARFPQRSAVRVAEIESLCDLAAESAPGSEEQSRALATASAALERFAEREPEDSHLEYVRGRVALARGEARRAVSFLQAAASRLDLGFVQYWLGRALEASGDLPAAERRYGLALGRPGMSPEPAIAMLRLAEARGDWPVVAEMARIWLMRSPDDEAAAATWVTALARAGDGPAALRVARAIAAQRPASAGVAALLAFALRVNGADEEALGVLEAARASSRTLAGSPDAELIAEEGHLRLGQGRSEEAARLFRRAILLEPAEPRFLVAAASLEYARGEFAAGRELIERALRLDPQNVEPLLFRARASLRSGDPDEALVDLQRASRIQPGDTRVPFLAGLAHEARGDRETARDAYAQAIAASSGNFAARNNLAMLLAEAGRLDEALVQAQAAYGLADHHPEVVDTLAGLYLEKGYARRAAGLYRRALAAGAGPRTKRNLVEAERAAGREEVARALAAELAEEIPADDPLRRELEAIVAR